MSLLEKLLSVLFIVSSFLLFLVIMLKEPIRLEVIERKIIEKTVYRSTENQEKIILNRSFLKLIERDKEKFATVFKECMTKEESRYGEKFNFQQGSEICHDTAVSYFGIPYTYKEVIKYAHTPLQKSFKYYPELDKE